MEDVENVDPDTGVDDKFERIMKDYKPTLYLAFFRKRQNMDAVIFEIGCICCKYGSHKIGRKLRFLGEKKYNWDKTTTCIKTLYPKAPRVDYDDTEEYSKASQLIHLFVLNM